MQLQLSTKVHCIVMLAAGNCDITGVVSVKGLFCYSTRGADFEEYTLVWAWAKYGQKPAGPWIKKNVLKN